MAKVTNYLLGYQDMYIVQDNEMFNFSLDSVLLPNFVTINKRVKKILDIGTGNAPIPLILSTKTKAQIIGVEIQEQVYELGLESVKMNNLESQITLINEDIKEFANSCETDTFDVITCNPPYFKADDSSNLNDSDYKKLARHELSLTLEDILKISKKLLKNNGVLAIVHRPDRLVEALELMRKYNIEPKRLQFIYPKKDKDTNMMLLEGAKNGKPGIKILSPIIAHNEDGSYTEVIKSNFERK